MKCDTPRRSPPVFLPDFCEQMLKKTRKTNVVKTRICSPVRVASSCFSLSSVHCFSLCFWPLPLKFQGKVLGEISEECLKCLLLVGYREPSFLQVAPSNCRVVRPELTCGWSREGMWLIPRNRVARPDVL